MNFSKKNHEHRKNNFNPVSKTLKFLTLLTFLCIGFTSCSKDDAPIVLEVKSEKATNLHAPQTGGQGQGAISGAFTKFDFATGKTTTSETDWDIAFRGTAIIVNGGKSSGTTDEPKRNGKAAAYITSGTLASVKSVVTVNLKQDAADGFAIKDWYNYSGPPKHLISPTPGKILVFKTRNGLYAKVEILSYYKDLDSSNPANSRHYTFNYVYQPNSGVTTF